MSTERKIYFFQRPQEASVLTSELVSRLKPALEPYLSESLTMSSLWEFTGPRLGLEFVETPVKKWYDGFFQCSDAERRQIIQTIRALDRFGIATVGQFRDASDYALRKIRHVGPARLTFACDLFGRARITLPIR